jgi:class 3 adenylate cyclase
MPANSAIEGAVYLPFMARVCPNCGAEAADGARFCSNCGTALDDAEGAERKLATMVFADLVGSTEIAAGLDPEVLRGRLHPFFEVARSSLREHGGTIEKYLGDAVLAVFGVPRTHGDDPDRAVAAALDLAERVGDLDDKLAVRIGVEAGEVLAQDGAGDLSVTGDAVNAAARLQQAAEPGEVLVGERAARYCRRAKLEPREAVDAKGMPEPLRAWRALESRREPEGPSVPLLGREDDLDLLRLVYRRCVRERVPELLLITGEAGIGKTRLAGELLGELRSDPDPPRILVGRNPPYGSGRGIAFWALAEILRDAAGAGPEAPVGEVEDSLAALLQRLGAEDGAGVAATLSAALGGEEVDAADFGEDELKHAWRRLVALLAEERPLVIGVDDAHCADDGLLDLLEEAVFRVQAAPLLLLCTSRPELGERRPDFGRTTPNVTQIELRPLKPDAATRLVELLLPEEAMALAPRAAEASGGNPFFAEEVACRIAEDPAAVPERLPDTVQGAIAARIDLLPADEKRGLQRASVLGHTFGSAGLSDLLGESSEAVLAGLERRALVRERAAGPGHYSFRHQLIRDVAYASLTRTERARLHERAADGIRRRAGARYSELAELVAVHLGRAAELDPSPARSQTASGATFEAAEAAARRGAVARAQELFEQVADLEADDAKRIEPLRAAADLALRRWRGDQALPLLREEAAAAEQAGDAGAAASAYARAVEVTARMSGITGQLPEEEVAAMLSRGRELVPEEDRATRTRLLLDEVWMAWHFERPEEMTEPAAEALRLAREVGDTALLSSALDAATADDWNRGQQRRAVERTAERLRLIERAPRSRALEVERGDALHMMVECLLQVGNFREAARYAAEARELDTARGIWYSAKERELLTTFFLGEWDRTLEMGTRFREEWHAAGEPPITAMCTAVGTVGAIYGYRGDDHRSRDWFEFTRNIAPDLRASGQISGVLMLEADVALHRGRAEAARELLAHPKGPHWWTTPYLATRAEAFVLSRDPKAEEALGAAADRVGEYLFAQGILARARGIEATDESLLRESLALFEQLESPYQAARSGWLLAGKARRDAERTFERLGAVPPTAHSQEG